MGSFKEIGYKYGLTESQVKEEYLKYWKHISQLFKEPHNIESIVIDHFGVFNLNFRVIPTKFRQFKNNLEKHKGSIYQNNLKENIDFYKKIMEKWEERQNY